MSARPHIVCIGSALWDTVGRAPHAVPRGGDVPGRIAVQPGGVALNVALTLKRLDLSPWMLSAVGRDAEGDALIAALDKSGIGTELIHRTDLPTDRYMAIEDGIGLVAAVADARSLETAGAVILAPLTDGRLGHRDAPFEGIAVIDGNLTEAILEEIAACEALRVADLRIVPASPGKAMRLQKIMQHPGATFYLNLHEARLLLGHDVSDAVTAARALARLGSGRILVTDGADTAAFAGDGGVVSAELPQVEVRRVTGAGDALMAAHIAAELEGRRGGDALAAALDFAATHIAGEPEG